MSVQSADNTQPAAKRRPVPLAVVGSQTSQDEVIFGRAFDKWVVTRFLGHLAPYKLRISIGVFAVVLLRFVLVLFIRLLGEYVVFRVTK